MPALCYLSVLTTGFLAACSLVLYQVALLRPLLYQTAQFPTALSWHPASVDIHWVGVAHAIGIGTASLGVILALYITLLAPKRKLWLLATMLYLTRLIMFPAAVLTFALDAYAGVAFALAIRDDQPEPQMQFAFAGLSMCAFLLQIAVGFCIWMWMRHDFGPSAADWPQEIARLRKNAKLKTKAKREADRLRKDADEQPDKDEAADVDDIVKIPPSRQNTGPTCQPSRNNSQPFSQASTNLPAQQWLESELWNDRRPAMPRFGSSRPSLPAYESYRSGLPGYRSHSRFKSLPPEAHPPPHMQRRATWDGPVTPIPNGPLEEDEEEERYRRPMRSATWGPDYASRMV